MGIKLLEEKFSHDKKQLNHADDLIKKLDHPLRYV